MMAEVPVLRAWGDWLISVKLEVLYPRDSISSGTHRGHQWLCVLPRDAELMTQIGLSPRTCEISILSLFFFLRKSQEGSHWVSKKISCILSNNSMRPGCLKRYYLSAHWLGFPRGSDSKESACNVGDIGLIPELGRSPGGGHGNPLQYSCLENPRGQRSLAGCSPWGCKESDTTEWLRMHDYHHGIHVSFWANHSCLSNISQIFWWFRK